MVFSFTLPLPNIDWHKLLSFVQRYHSCALQNAVSFYFLTLTWMKPCNSWNCANTVPHRFRPGQFHTPVQICACAFHFWWICFLDCSLEAFILSDDDDEDYNDLEEDVFVDPGFTPEEYYSDEENADCNILETPGNNSKSCAKITRLIQPILACFLGKENVGASPFV